MKVQIPESVKEVLRCGECKQLLSCGPVYLEHKTNKAICGRCSQPSLKEAASKTQIQGRSRNVQYEAAAKLLAFPCRYADQGCRKKIDFSEEEPNIHERDCDFRTFNCPVFASGSCDWVGSFPVLSEHCRDVHPGHFIENPFVLPKPDLEKPISTNFLVTAFDALFLLHLKVCVESGKLFHALRMFGDSKLLDKFSYSFEIKTNDSKIIKEGSVLRAGILMLQEPTANFILIDNLFDILDGKYNESEFTIIIRASLGNCGNCLQDFDDVTDSQYCKKCLGQLEKCKFNEEGCLFVDFDWGKCWKHEEFFCEYQPKCYLCNIDLDETFFEHLTSSSACDKIIQSNMNSIVRVTPIPYSDVNIILFSSNNIGTIVCLYNFTDTNFQFNLCTSFPSYELKKYKCSIELADPQTKHTLHLNPEIECTATATDWSIDEKMDNFPSCKTIGIDLKINIEKSE